MIGAALNRAGPTGSREGHCGNPHTVVIQLHNLAIVPGQGNWPMCAFSTHK